MAAKTLNGRKRTARPYAGSGREYERLMEKLGLNQKECSKLFGFAGRTSRRYKRGDGRVPISALKLMRLMATGKVTKRQVMQA